MTNPNAEIAKLEQMADLERVVLRLEARKARALEKTTEGGPLPRLHDRKSLAAELGVKLATAERIMRAVPIVKIGSRVFVTDTSVCEYLRNGGSTADISSTMRRESGRSRR